MLLKILTWGKIKVIFKILSLSGKWSTWITSYITSQLNILFVVPHSFLLAMFPFILNRIRLSRQTQKPHSL